jgi:hypothetical protein
MDSFSAAEGIRALKEINVLATVTVRIVTPARIREILRPGIIITNAVTNRNKRRYIIFPKKSNRQN